MNGSVDRPSESAIRLPCCLKMNQPCTSDKLRLRTHCLAIILAGIVMLFCGSSTAFAQLSSFEATDSSTVPNDGVADGIPSSDFKLPVGSSMQAPADFEPNGLLFQVPASAREPQSTSERQSNIHWDSLIGEEFLYIAVKTGDRAFQAKTRNNFGGPFFSDWEYIVQHINVNRWSDGGKWFTNNVGHPMDGSIYAFIYRRNDDGVRDLRFDLHDREYRKGILKAFLVSSLASVESEIGPLSEATIGHVGLKAGWYLRGSNGALQGPVPQDVIGLATLTKSPYWVRGGNGTGLTDFIMTPFGGVAVMLGEDAMDKYVIEKLEEHIHNRYWVATIRCFLNPTRSAGNLFSFAAPWHRDSR
jgi:hypothetical protein